MYICALRHLIIFIAATATATATVTASSCDTVHRPNLYVGTKTCSPHPISTGLMWYAKGDITKIRHTAEMNDNLKKWGWAAHNGADYGRHVLLDPKAQIHLIAEYTKDSNSTSWTMHITGNLTKKGKKKTEKERDDITLIFYVTNADPAGIVQLQSQTTSSGPSAVISGHSTKEGDFTFQVLRTKSAVPKSRRKIVTHHQNRPHTSELAWRSTELHSTQIRRDPTGLWQTRELLEPFLQKSQASASREIVDRWKKQGKDPQVEGHKKNTPQILPLLLNTTEKNANIVALQFVVAAPFELVIRYDENNDGNDHGDDDHSSDARKEEEKNDVNKIPTKFLETFRELASKATEKFEEKFENVFGLRSKGFDGKHIAFAQAAFSNLIGSVTYFYGSSTVKPKRSGVSPGTTRSGPLITGVPSRSFFPRGFLWDEGFHQLLVSAWDPSLSQTVVTHWLHRMDKNGWIPREQILGAEATSKVPEKFRLQSPDIANPPALLLTIENMLYSLEHSEHSEEVLNDGRIVSTTGQQHQDKQQLLEFLASIYPKFSLHYKWLKKTQSGDVRGSFRWRGQTSTHCLASGLDDFPRARYFTTGERHVDLLSWMIYAADVLSRLSTHLDRKEEALQYKVEHDEWKISLEEHWSEKDGTWYDIGVDRAEHIDPQTGRVLRLAAPAHVEHFGYVGLFPFLLKIVDTSNTKRLIRVMNNMLEPHLLWSQYGLRSLSRLDMFFGKEEDYWRGKIWLNINYLALRSLHYYSINAKSNDVRILASEVHGKLRKNLIDNLYKQYRRSGFVWENYSPQNGRGKGCFPFSGWSSLIVSIMAELYQ